MNVDSDGWLFLLLFGSFGAVFIFLAAMSVWHFFVDEPAVEGGERAILQFGASLKRELKRRGLAAGK